MGSSRGRKASILQRRTATASTLFTEGLDIDIAAESLAPEYFLTLMSALAAELGREVELVDLSRCHFFATHSQRWYSMDSRALAPCRLYTTSF